MRCRTCERESPEGMRFCGHCGAALTSGQTTVEHRQLTVLFCDLVDSTALAGRLEVEELRELILEYQAVVGAVVERHGGHVAQLLGDGLLIYFGYPRAGEHDALCAVEAGLDILEAVASLSRRLESRGGSQVSVRLGIHTGLVVAGELGTGRSREQLALGETPLVAARLQGLARPDSVVISAATQELLGDAFRYQPLGLHPLKDLSRPVQVLEVLEKAPASLNQLEK